MGIYKDNFLGNEERYGNVYPYLSLKNTKEALIYYVGRGWLFYIINQVIVLAGKMKNGLWNKKLIYIKRR